MAGREELASTWESLRIFAESSLGRRREAGWLVDAVRDGPARGWSSVVGGGEGEPPTESQQRLVRVLVQRRLSGEPLQYVLGAWQFRSVELGVDRRALIPRPETEQVVEVALRELRRVAALHHGACGIHEGGEAIWANETALWDEEWDEEGEAVHETSFHVVDLGTGSGAIAMSVASEVLAWPVWARGGDLAPGAEKSQPADLMVWATDISAEALGLAEENTSRLGDPVGRRIRFSQGDWWRALPNQLAGKVSVAIANPPYISTEEMATLDPVVADWEPRGALEAGPTGREAHERILSDARLWLKPEGAIVVEIAPHQAEDVAALAKAAGLADVEVHLDLAGRERAVVARRKR